MPRKSTKNLFRRGDAQKFNKKHVPKPSKKISHIYIVHPSNSFYFFLIALTALSASVIILPSLLGIIRNSLSSLSQIDFRLHIENPGIILPEITLPQINIPKLYKNIQEIINLQIKATNLLLLSTQTQFVIMRYLLNSLNPFPVLNYLYKLTIFLIDLNAFQLLRILNLIKITLIIINPIPLISIFFSLLLSGLGFLIQIIVEILRFVNPIPVANNILEVEKSTISNIINTFLSILNFVINIFFTILKWFYEIVFNIKEFIAQKLFLLWLQIKVVFDFFAPFNDYIVRIVENTLNNFTKYAKSLLALI